MATTNHPGDAEYLGAVRGMQDAYGGTGRVHNGRVISSYAVGERIRWRDDEGHICHGIVVEVLTDTDYHVRSHVPDYGNVHHHVREDQTLPL